MDRHRHGVQQEGAAGGGGRSVHRPREHLLRVLRVRVACARHRLREEAQHAEGHVDHIRRRAGVLHDRGDLDPVHRVRLQGFGIIRHGPFGIEVNTLTPLDEDGSDGPDLPCSSGAHDHDEGPRGRHSARHRHPEHADPRHLHLRRLFRPVDARHGGGERVLQHREPVHGHAAPPLRLPGGHPQRLQSGGRGVPLLRPGFARVRANRPLPGGELACGRHGRDGPRGVRMREGAAHGVQRQGQALPHDGGDQLRLGQRPLDHEGRILQAHPDPASVENVRGARGRRRWPPRRRQPRL
mmetsp:Transcript_42341/g.126708  ORF Transcript_42341/g.126708 Transcript_42341/m.126708 type:complete len:296 (-) Transcript_42341:249-1136(-)